MSPQITRIGNCGIVSVPHDVAAVADVAANSLYTRIAATPATPATLLCLAKAQDASFAGADAGEDNSPPCHEIAILGQVLPERGDAYGVQVQLSVELCSGALPLNWAGHHEVEDAEHVVGDLALLKLLLAGLLDKLPLAVVHPDLVLLELNVSPRNGERGPVGASVEVVEDHGAVGRARDSVGSAHGVEHVGVAHLAVVVDAEDGEPALVGELLQGVHVAVVRGIRAVLADAAHHLEGVDDDQARLGVFGQKLPQLRDEVSADFRRRRCDVEPGARLVRELPQPLLNAALRVLQAKVQNVAGVRLKVPERRSRAYAQRHLQGHPALACFGRSNQQREPGGEKVLDNPRGTRKGLLDKPLGINRCQIAHACAPFRQ